MIFFTKIKKNVLIVASICLVVSFIFLFGDNALASSVFNMLDYPNDIYANIANGAGVGGYVLWNWQPPTDINGVNSFQINYYRAGTTYPNLSPTCSLVDLTIWNNDSLTTDVDTFISSTTFIGYTGNAGEFPDNWICNYALNSELNFSSSTIYGFRFKPSYLATSSENLPDYFTSSYHYPTSTYANGNIGYFDGTYHNNSSLKGLAISFDTDNLLSPSLVLITPSSGDVSQNNVLISGLWRDDDLDFNQIYFEFENVPYTYGYLDFYDYASTTGAYWKYKQLDNDNWRYRARLQNYNTNATTTFTDWIYFSVSSSSPTQIFVKPTEEEICEGVATSTFFGGIECGIKKAFVWAVWPSDKSVNDFKNSYTDLQNSFPFSVFYQLTNAVDSAINTTTPTMGDSLGVPMIDKHGGIYILPIINSSSVSSTIGNENAELFRNTGKWFIWFGVAVVIFFTLV